MMLVVTGTQVLMLAQLTLSADPSPQHVFFSAGDYEGICKSPRLVRIMYRMSIVQRAVVLSVVDPDLQVAYPSVLGW